MNTSYYTFKEPTINCKDMDARLRGTLLQFLGQTVHYDFSYKASEALIKRMKEITPFTIDMLLRAIPHSFPIIDRIWRAFPEGIMDKIVRDKFWDSDNAGYNMPHFMKDYVKMHGTTLLDKYEHIDMILVLLTAKCRHDNAYESDSMGGPMDTAKPPMGPVAGPELYVKYYKRLRRLPKRWKGAYSYNAYWIDQIGKAVMEGYLNIDLNPLKEAKANESGD